MVPGKVELVRAINTGAAMDDGPGGGKKWIECSDYQVEQCNRKNIIGGTAPRCLLCFFI